MKFFGGSACRKVPVVGLTLRVEPTKRAAKCTYIPVGSGRQIDSQRMDVFVACQNDGFSLRGNSVFFYPTNGFGRRTDPGAREDLSSFSGGMDFPVAVRLQSEGFGRCTDLGFDGELPTHCS